MFKIYKVLIVETLTIVVKQVIEQLGENKTFVQKEVKSPCMTKTYMKGKAKIK